MKRRIKPQMQKNTFIRCWLQSIILSMLVLCISLPATASILIWPTRLVIEHGEKAAALWLENQGNEAKVMQLRVYAWTQQDGAEQLLEQRNVVGSPPMMRIEPGKRQLVRLINNAPPPDGKEQTYRIILDEIPFNEATDAGEKPPSQQGIRFQLRYSLPLFIYGLNLKGKTTNPVPLENIASTLSWRTVQEGGKTWLEISNQGTMHVHLEKITFVNTKQQTTPPASDLSGYVLAGAYMRWALPDNIGLPHELTATIDSRGSATIKQETK